MAGLVSDAGRRESVLIESKDYEHFRAGGGSTALDHLASLLATAGQAGSMTLPFRGYLEVESMVDDESKYAFVFDFPQGVAPQEPVSLHDALMMGDSRRAVSLATRFRLAEMIAKSVWHLHNVGWIHKSIWSQNIVFFRSNSGNVDFTRAFVAGFEYSRREGDTTVFSGFDEDREKNLYRHPDRQGPPTTRFTKAHDLYALGLVLLEIGLWRSLGSLVEEEQRQRVEPVMTGKAKPVKHTPWSILELFRHVSDELLSHTMGDAYAEAVRKCLGATASGADDSAEVYTGIVEQVSLESLNLSAA